MQYKRIYLKFGLLILIYFILVIPTSVLILFQGSGDINFVIVYGIANFLFLIFALKINTTLSLILGFINSSLSILLTYLINYIKPFFEAEGILIFILLSIIITFIITKLNLSEINLKKLSIILTLPTLFLIIFSFKIKEFYRPKSENEKLKKMEIKVLDENGKPKSGDSIEVRIKRYPIFGMRESHEIDKTLTGKNGTAEIVLSQNHNYVLFIFPKDKLFTSFEIDSTDIRLKNKFSIIEE